MDYTVQSSKREQQQQQPHKGRKCTRVRRGMQRGQSRGEYPTWHDTKIHKNTMLSYSDCTGYRFSIMMDDTTNHIGDHFRDVSFNYCTGYHSLNMLTLNG